MNQPPVRSVCGLLIFLGFGSALSQSRYDQHVFFANSLTAACYSYGTGTCMPPVSLPWLTARFR